MKNFVAMLAVLATAGLLAACQPGKPVHGHAHEGHSMSAEKTDMSSHEAAPAASGKSGRTFEAQ